jgi:casein kinase II subunit alpha
MYVCRGKDNKDQLVKIAKVLGTDTMDAWMDKYGLQISFRNQMGHYPKKPWRKFITSENAHLTNPQALDLLDQLLRYDPEERLTAREAMSHPYFDRLKEI